MLDLNQVRVFVQVVRARSFVAAARRLGVPPNTLSRHVRLLEASLDTRLMQRSTRKLTLTAAGAAFYERCSPAVDDVLEAGRDVIDGSQIPSGNVRIAAPADFLDLFAVEWIKDFLAQHPKVRLDFVLSDGRADLIGESIDVAFRGGAVGDAQLVHRRLSAQYFKLVASPSYIERRGVPATLQDLTGHDCLTVSAQGPVTWSLRGPGGDEDVRVTGRFSANTARILAKSCVAGLGIALMPGMLVTPDILAGHLLHVLPDYRGPGADFSVILPSRQQVPAAVAAFVEFATAKLESIISSQLPSPRRARRK